MSELISIAVARERVLEATRGRERAGETVDVESALGRILAAGVQAAADVPPFANSAMDGYAVRTGEARRRLTVTGEARAGRPAATRVEDGTAVRISTGAALPPGAEAVVRQEDARREGDEVIVEVAAETGRNVRPAGDDLRRGDIVLEPGAELTPAGLALAVSAGAASLVCAARPRVAVLCTGDELKPPGAPLSPGQIHNSNAAGLAGAASRAGAEVVVAGAVADTRDATREALAHALDRSDVVVVSGGVSVGPHDHVKPALSALGVEERFWGVALRPGKPTWFGVRENSLVFGLPGNPVSALVTFRLFVQPALRALLGREPEPPPLSARLARAVRREPREHALRVRLAHEDGRLCAVPAGAQGSHQLSALAAADALALVPAGEGELAAGESVAVLAL